MLGVTRLNSSDDHRSGYCKRWQNVFSPIVRSVGSREMLVQPASNFHILELVIEEIHIPG